ncbi:hypothetical protein G7Z99_00185 [Pseudomonas entomophila]|uniref:hypothetical protein n=1 Tax=Pseudomonas entomophila TaxID=312306 RepID=UPI0015E398BF|nr:hypothetical protein [Pseudomonas entomophila]MBA1187466.1 hypothetical protein [Pseudomonas entomophila]
MNDSTARTLSTSARLAAPIIESLNGYDEIDLERLADQSLVTFIQYDGIQLGDRLRLNWRGASATGEPLDDVSTEMEVETPDFDPVSKRLKVNIPNAFLVGADQGYAFYSYERLTGVPEESLRTFCFVGVRRHRMEHMPVAQALSGHALHIDPATLGSAGCRFLAPAYQAMQADDQVTLHFSGYFEDGEFDRELVFDYLVTDQNVGRNIRWTVPRGEFNWLEGGHADVFYRIAFVDGCFLESAPQTYRIGPPPADPALLAAPFILGHAGGPLDPADFPEGLTIRIPPYKDLHTADWTLLQVNDEPGSAALRADLTTLASGIQGICLGADALDDQTQLRLRYQVAREGLGLVSQELDLEVLRPRELSSVQIDNAESESPEPNMVLDADLATTGAYVDVPDPGLRSGECLQLHWQGRSSAGRHVHTLPEGSKPPFRFAVPASVVAANMEATADKTEDKRFPVFYRLVRDAGGYQESPLVQLRILPLLRSRYPTIQCDKALGGTLSLAAVPANGATLILRDWVFMAAGQRVRVIFRGVKANHQQLVTTLRDADVTADEVQQENVVVMLSREVLSSQGQGFDFTIEVRVNFENETSDDTWFDFPSLVLTLQA